MYIDTHAHLYAEDLKDSLDDIIAQCLEEKITHICMPNIDNTSIQPMLDLYEKYDFCHPMIGLHPCYVKEGYKEQLKAVVKESERGIYKGIGECGIDLYWDKTHVAEQKEAFAYQIDMARDMDLPIIIHSRDSLDITIDMIADRQNGKLRGIFHCFNGTIDQSKAIMDAGFLMGAGGVITYKNAGLAPVYEYIPLENIVLETDAPYLSPTPHRGKKNSPHYIPLIAEKLASIKGIAVETVAEETSKNAQNIFSLI